VLPVQVERAGALHRVEQRRPGGTYLGRYSLADAHRRGEIETSGSRDAVKAHFDAFRQSPVSEMVAAATGQRESTS
jgi:hypothetical protein